MTSEITYNLFETIFSYVRHTFFLFKSRLMNSYPPVKESYDARLPVSFPEFMSKLKKIVDTESKLFSSKRVEKVYSGIFTSSA